MDTIPELKVKLVEVDGSDLEYETEVNLSLEKVFSETNLFGKQNLLDVINFVRNNSSIVNFLDSGSNRVSNNAGGWVDVPNMSVIPGVLGQYIVLAFMVTEHSFNNGLADFALSKNGARYSDTVTSITYPTKDASLVIPLIKVVTIDNLTDVIKAQWNDVNGRIRADNRYLFMLRVSE